MPPTPRQINSPDANLPRTRIHGLTRRRHRRSESAFTLVEIVLSIGVISFAFVALFGLMPAGLEVFRQSMETSVGSQIVQRVINEAQQTDYPTLISTPPTTRYFDEQGNELAVADDSIYTVEISVISPTILPGAEASATASLATVVVKIANDPAHGATPFADPKKYTAYSALVAKNL